MSAVAQARVRAMIDSYRLSQALIAAAELRLADLLRQAPMEAQALARAAGADAAALERLLRLLVGLELLERLPDGRVALTAAGELLAASGASLRQWALFSARLYRAWTRLPATVRSGRGGGAHRWDELAAAPEEARVFNLAMSWGANRLAQAMLGAVDFQSVRTLVDLGGGDGTLIEALLAAHPHCHGILLDLPSAVDDARSRLDGAPVLPRLHMTAGNFFEQMPERGDLYILCRVVHDWPDDAVADLLRRVRRAARPGASVVLVERLLDDRCHELENALSDLNMLVMNGGRERTEAEFRRLLEAAGLAWARSTPTDTPLHVIQAFAVR